MNIPQQHEGRARRRKAWTSYWQSGALHSFPTSYSGNYDGVIAAFWRRVASTVPAGGRVLDLASGNGSVPLLLLPHLAEGVRIDAVDAAVIAPVTHPSNSDQRIEFHPGVWLEQLPFFEGAFDCVSSQFGIEYAVQSEAWDEVFRVLGDLGQVACVIHHSESVFCTTARHETRHLQWLLADDGLLASAYDVAGWLETMRLGRMLSVEERKDADASKAQFNVLQRLLEARIHEERFPDVLSEVRAQVSAILTKATKPTQTLVAYRELLDQTLVRCHELVDCSIDQRQMEALITMLRSKRKGIDIGIEELSQEQGLLAWGLRVVTGTLLGSAAGI